MPSKSLASVLKLQAKRKAAGLCLDCGTVPADQGLSRCSACLRRRRERTASYVSRGLCQYCRKAQADNGHSSCSACRDHKAAQADARRTQRRAAGLCLICGKGSVVPPFTICAPCRSLKADREQGLMAGQREEVMAHDGFRCRLCGSQEALRVHHRDGSGQSRLANHGDGNLVTLCLPCHHQLHNAARFIQDPDLFSELLMELTKEAEL